MRAMMMDTDGAEGEGGRMPFKILFFAIIDCNGNVQYSLT